MRLVAANIQTLGLKRKEGIRVDAYGVVDARRWNKECQYFMDRVVRPVLTPDEAHALGVAGLSEIANELIEEPARLECRLLERGHAITAHVVSAQDAPNWSPGSRPPSLGISTGLIIRAQPLSSILSGLKTWEMRSKRTPKRETIALIEQGSKSVRAVADIDDCLGPLSRHEMVMSYEKHRIDESRLDDSDVSTWRLAWVLSRVQPLKHPVMCRMKPGAVTFVSLDEATARAVVSAL